MTRETKPGDVVVVIDPDNRKQVERLVECYSIELQRDLGDLNDCMQAALREFANPTPPKPDEPTGLGAVVEDADGETWVSIPVEGAASCHEWICSHSRGGWSSVDAVKVLSAGWSE